MSKMILDFRPEHDGFQFNNSWSWTDSDQDYFVQEIKEFADKAIFILGMKSRLIPVVGDLIPLDPVSTAIALGFAIAAGAGEKLVREIFSQVKPKSFGMCGGMAHAATDYWKQGWIVPGISHPPANPGSTSPSAEEKQLRFYIRERLVDKLKSHLLDFLQVWLEVKDQSNQKHFPRMPFRDRLVAEYTKIRQRIDQGELVTIGVIGNSEEPWNMHQVLCYGYMEHVEGSTYDKELYIYDPNARRKDIRIKLRLELFSWRKVNHNFSEIWTNIDTSKISPKRPNWLGYIFAVDYTQKTPPKTLTVKRLELQSTDGLPRLRTDIPVEIEADIEYHGPANSLSFHPYLRQRHSHGRIVDDVGDAPGGMITIPSGTTKTIRWITQIPASPGERTLELLAHRSSKDSLGSSTTTYEWFQELRDSSDKLASAKVYLYDLPSTAKIHWRFNGSVPQPGQVANQLFYPIALSVADTLDPSATYYWSINGTNANGTVQGTPGSNTAMAEVLVNLPVKSSSQITIEVRGIEPAGQEIFGRVVIPLPLAQAILEVLRAKSTVHGSPRMRTPQGSGWKGSKAILMQAYSTVMVRLSWSHFAGIPTRIHWTFSDSLSLFSPPPGANLQDGSWEIPVSTVGENFGDHPQHPPKAVIIKCSVEDAAGQKVVISRPIDPWYEVSYYVPEHVLAEDPHVARARVLEILPEVREKLMQSFAQSLSDESMEGLYEQIDRTLAQVSDIQVGPFIELAYQDHPDLHPEMLMDTSIPFEETVLRFAAPDEVLLTEEAEMDYDIVERMEPEVVGEQAMVGHVEMLYTSELVQRPSIAGGKLLALLGIED